MKGGNTMKNRELSLAQALAKRKPTTVQSSFVEVIAKANSQKPKSGLADVLTKARQNSKSV
jgi:hypothetical protein